MIEEGATKGRTPATVNDKVYLHTQCTMGSLRRAKSLGEGKLLLRNVVSNR